MATMSTSTSTIATEIAATMAVPSAPAEPPMLLTPREAAQQLHISESQLKNMRLRGDGPDFIRLGHRTVRYSQEAIAAYINQSCQPGKRQRQLRPQQSELQRAPGQSPTGHDALG